MNTLMISWYVNLMLVVVLGIATVRAFFDSVSEKTPEIKKALAPAMTVWLFFATVSGVVLLYMPFGLMSEYIQPKFGWVVLTVLAAIIVAWYLGCFTSGKTEEDDQEPVGVVAVLKSMLPKPVQEAMETVYGIDPTKPALTEKSLFVDESTPPTEGWWAGVSNWRTRDFKGSLVQWLRDNGPKSHLIPATFELYLSLAKGVYPPRNKELKFSPEGLSMRTWDKKYFYKWDELVFHIKYNLYEREAAVDGNKLLLKPTTIYLTALDGTEIGWVRDEDKSKIGNFDVELKFPKKVVSQIESYVFEYQDGVSGCYEENIPVYYFVSDLAKKVKEEKKVAIKS